MKINFESYTEAGSAPEAVAWSCPIEKMFLKISQNSQEKIITSNFLKNPQSGNDMAFHRIFPFYGNLYIHKHWEFHGFS